MSRGQEKQLLPDRERANDFPDAIKKLIDEKGYLLEQIFNADENVLYSLKQKCH